MKIIATTIKNGVIIPKIGTKLSMFLNFIGLPLDGCYLKKVAASCEIFSTCSFAFAIALSLDGSN